MQAVVFIGIQGTGKSTFFAERFRDTHVRLNLDMLKTRRREALLLSACLESGQPFVVDNTNPTIEDRARYVSAARAAKFEIVGYYFESKIADALARNDAREESKRVPHAGVLGTYNKLQLPALDEGFSALFYVQLSPDGFIVKEWTP